MLPFSKRERIKRYYRKADQYRSLVADILIRTIVMDRLGISNDGISFESNEYGKPFLAGHPDFHFNLSHAGDWVVCAVDEQQVGIDVEQIHSFAPQLAEFCFSPEEYANFMAKQEDERHRIFSICGH